MAKALAFLLSHQGAYRSRYDRLTVMDVIRTLCDTHDPPKLPCLHDEDLRVSLRLVAAVSGADCTPAYMVMWVEVAKLSFGETKRHCAGVSENG
jgi:hypothetical protein